MNIDPSKAVEGYIPLYPKSGDAFVVQGDSLLAIQNVPETKGRFPAPAHKVLFFHGECTLTPGETLTAFIKLYDGYRLNWVGKGKGDDGGAMKREDCEVARLIWDEIESIQMAEGNPETLYLKGSFSHLGGVAKYKGAPVFGVTEALKEHPEEMPKLPNLAVASNGGGSKGESEAQRLQSRLQFWCSHMKVACESLEVSCDDWSSPYHIQQAMANSSVKATGQALKGYSDFLISFF